MGSKMKWITKMRAEINEIKKSNCNRENKAKRFFIRADKFCICLASLRKMKSKILILGMKSVK